MAKSNTKNKKVAAKGEKCGCGCGCCGCGKGKFVIFAVILLLTVALGISVGINAIFAQNLPKADNCGLREPAKNCLEAPQGEVE